MQPLKTLIVDDEYPARRELRHLLEKYNDIQVVGEATNSGEALQLLSALDYAVLFLDVDIPGSNGLELCRQIRDWSKSPLVIFVTAHEKFAAEAFSVNAVDYLLKPVDPQRLEKAIRKVYQFLQAGELAPRTPGRPPEAEEKRHPLGLVPVEHRGKIILIEEKNIIYIYASGDYTYIKTAKEKYLTRFTLKELENRLNPNLFFRCHRSYLVNIKKAKEVIPLYNGTLVLIVDDNEKSEVPVSRSQAKTIRKLLGI